MAEVCLSKIWEKIRPIFMYSESHSQRIRKDRFTLYLTPAICMLFFNNLIFVLATISSCRLISREVFMRLEEEESRDELSRLEEVELSRMVTEALRAVPSGLKIFCNIYENSGGISVDCQVSYCRVFIISLLQVF